MPFDVFTFVLVVEVTEVNGTGYRDHLSNPGWRPTGDDVPHALATCQGETVALVWHRSVRHTLQRLWSITRLTRGPNKTGVSNISHGKSTRLKFHGLSFSLHYFQWTRLNPFTWHSYLRPDFTSKIHMWISWSVMGEFSVLTFETARKNCSLSTFFKMNLFSHCFVFPSATIFLL